MYFLQMGETIYNNYQSFKSLFVDVIHNYFKYYLKSISSTERIQIDTSLSPIEVRGKQGCIAYYTYPYANTKANSLFSWLVGWLDFTACQPIGLFYAENVFIIFIWYNFYAYSYLNAINKYQRHQNKTICSLELSAEVSI